MFVGPSWAELDHGGFIVALFVPGTSTPCPALAPGSRVRVVPDARHMGASSVPPFGSENSLRPVSQPFNVQEPLRVTKRSRSPSADVDESLNDLNDGGGANPASNKTWDSDCSIRSRASIHFHSQRSSPMTTKMRVNTRTFGLSP
jgi:hypothetical protein